MEVVLVLLLCVAAVGGVFWIRRQRAEDNKQWEGPVGTFPDPNDR